MREIKFRAWDRGEKQWLNYYGISFFVSGQAVGFQNEIVELSQYTGLKDKNGKEIYEGDILSYNWGGNDYRPIVFFYEGMFLLDHPEESVNLALGMYSPEVIGNIYENPELLNPENPVTTQSQAILEEPQKTR